MAIRTIRSATVFCPPAVTGGPQALHQLAFALNGLGIDTEIAYYPQREGSMRVYRQGLVCTPPERNPCLEAYADYAPRVCVRARFGPDRLIVLPQERAPWAMMMGPCAVAVWWLGSADVGAGSALAGLETRERVLAREGLIHLSGTHFLAEALAKRAAGPVAVLSDYVAEPFTVVEPAGPNPDPVVGFNPRKAGDLAERFAAAHPDIPLRPIERLAREEVAPALRRLRAYVDFTSFPGRELMPREAAACGAVVLVRRIRAGADPRDFPLEERFKFADAEIDGGGLAQSLRRVLADPEPDWSAQAAFRASVRGEKAAFFEQVRRLFGPEG